MSTWSSVERKLNQYERKVMRKIEARQLRFPIEPIEFLEQKLGFKPTEYQRELAKLFIENQFVAARWCRQSGKSHVIAALLLHYALTHPDIYIAVVGPSWRQTKLIIRKINGFLRKLPRGTYHKPQKTIVQLTNGSLIEAFPNNPETIREPTLHVVYCDEMNFISNDEELYDAILFTLGTTNGKFICSSTPWHTDSMFYKIFNHEDYDDFKRSHVTWREALEPNGPLKKSILDKIRRQFQGDPWRWRREMEAEWAEDENVWLPQALIAKCIDEKLEYYAFEDRAVGEFYLGLDFGKHLSHSVVAIVEKLRGGEKTKLNVVYMRQFALGTPYATVIGHVKTLFDRWRSVEQICADVTGVGDYIVEDMRNAGIPNVEGVLFSTSRKEELATSLKQKMLDGALFIPYDGELIAELNVERFELRKTGGVNFNHPEGTKDDRFWALCLAVEASTKETPSRLVRAY